MTSNRDHTSTQLISSLSVLLPSITSINTGVCTSFILWLRSLLMMAGISIWPSALACPRAVSRATNVPVRPAPALHVQQETDGLLTSALAISAFLVECYPSLIDTNTCTCSLYNYTALGILPLITCTYVCNKFTIMS